MEVKAYLRILVQKWWLVIPALLITLGATAILTFTQQPVFESTATFIVKPNDAFPTGISLANSINILSLRTEIAYTYVEIATSARIKKNAVEQLGLTAEQKKNMVIDSRLRGGTNVLEITVSGPDPSLVQALANQVGAETVLYVNEVYDIYELKPLDAAPLPRSSIKPDKVLNLALGGILGLGLGVALSFLSTYLETPSHPVVTFDIVDAETGAYKERYFARRLAQEISRAKRNKYPLAVASIDVDHLGVTQSLPHRSRISTLRQAAALLQQNLRDEDIMAHVDGSTFAILLPDLTGHQAQTCVEEMQATITSTPFELGAEGSALNLVSAAGIAAYSHNGTSSTELLATARQALEEAKSSANGKVSLNPETT